MGGGLSKKARVQLKLAKNTGGTEINLSDCELRKLSGFRAVVKLKLLVSLDLSFNQIQRYDHDACCVVCFLFALVTPTPREFLLSIPF